MARHALIAFLARGLDKIQLWNILLVSVGLRIVVALILGNSIEEMPGIFDQISYHTLATRVLEGYGFTFGEEWWPLTAAGAPTAHWSYLYTGYLVLVYQVFGVNPLIARLLQAAVVGLAMPWIVYRLSTRIFGARVGLIAALWVTCYGYFVYYAAALITESFFIVTVLWSLDTAVRLGQNENIHPLRDGLELGIALGISTLLRQLFLMLIPLILLWLLWTRFHRTPIQSAVLRTLLQGAIAAGLVLILIAPFTYYNYLRFDRFVLLNTNSGYVFFWGNHPIYGSNFVPILPASMGSYQSLIPEEIKGLDEAALDSELLVRGLHFVAEDPVRYMALSASRIPVYFNFWPSTSSSLPSNLTRVLSFGIALPFMLIGLYQWIKQLSFASSRAVFAQPQSLLVIFMSAYSGIHVLTWTLIRYRLPVDAIAIVFAAQGLHGLWLRISKQTTYQVIASPS